MEETAFLVLVLLNYMVMKRFQYGLENIFALRIHNLLKVCHFILGRLNLPQNTRWGRKIKSSQNRNFFHTGGRFVLIGSVFFFQMGCLPLDGTVGKSEVKPDNTNARPTSPINLNELFYEEVLSTVSVDDQLQKMCQDDPRGQDRVKKAFCDGPNRKAPLPNITSLAQLEALLGLTPENSAFALTGQSSSLVIKSVNPLLPRIVVFHEDPRAVPDYIAIGFVRDKHSFIEILAKDPSDPNPATNLRFYLFVYRHSCELQTGGCTNADFFTETIESNWIPGAYSIFTDDDLENTFLDCKRCHQPGGPGTPRFARMQEKVIPWAHWFSPDSLTSVVGQTMIDTYRAAFGNLPYAGRNVANSEPNKLEIFMDLGGHSELQNNMYDSDIIQNEVIANDPQQPARSFPVGESAEWRRIFNEYKAGRAINVPHVNVLPTNADSLADMTLAYQNLLAGNMAREDFPNPQNIFLESHAWMMGQYAEPGSTVQEILNQSCVPCHNPQLDQTLSRARFVATDLTANTSAELKLAINRLQMEEDKLLHMPPVLMKRLLAQDKITLINEMQSIIDQRNANP